MSQSTVPSEPGWYPDAADPSRERWWDGATWSQVTRPRDAGRSTGSEVQLPPPPPVNPSPPPANPSPPPVSPSSPPVNPYAAPPSGREAGGSGGPQAPVPPWGLPSSPPPGPGGALRLPGLGPMTPDGVALASPWLRLLARFLDTVITSLLTLAAGAHYVAHLLDLARPELEAVTTGAPGADLSTLLDDPAFTEVMLRYGFVGLLVGGVYSVLLTHLLGGTLGKLMVGIRVRSWEEPGRPTWGQALARWLTREVVSQITFAGIGSVYWIIDSVWLLRDPRRQCLHDKVPGTVVVRHR